MRHWFRKIRNLCLDLLFPLACVHCNENGFWLCAACRSNLPILPERCPFCLMPSEYSKTCARCQSKHQLNGLFSVTEYASPLAQTLIHGLKYKYWSDLAPTLAQVADERLRAPIDWFKATYPNAVLVPIPLHRTRHKQRGFNQAERLAQALSELWAIPCPEALIRLKKTKAQARLVNEQRNDNVRNAFGLKTGIDLSGKSVIIVDDVFTTGATLASAAAVCRRAGCQTVWGLVFARS